MIGRRPDQQSLFAADTQYLEFVGEDSFYGFLARHGRELFRDEQFAELYCPDLGRPSVPPSLLGIALLLQAHDRVPSVHDPEQRHGHKSHFFGRAKTRFQLLMAATVANLTLVANWMSSCGCLRALMRRFGVPVAALTRNWSAAADPRWIWREAKMLLTPSAGHTGLTVLPCGARVGRP